LDEEGSYFNLVSRQMSRTHSMASFGTSRSTVSLDVDVDAVLGFNVDDS